MSARPGQLGGVACERLFRFAGTWPNLVLSNPCTFHDGSTALFGGSLGIDGFGGIGGVMLAVGPQRYLHTVAWELAGTCAIQEIGDPGSANLTDAGPRGLRVGDFTQTARIPAGIGSGPSASTRRWYKDSRSDRAWQPRSVGMRHTRV